MAYWKNQIMLAATVGVVSLLIVGSAPAGDWPTWRADANRSAATDEQLPDSLSLNWTINLPPLTPAWNEEDSRIHFDACYEPIVAGHTMIVASSRNNSVTAIDTRTAATKWRVFAEAPVRFAPVAADGTVYFGADDGRFYCVDMADGKLRWQFDAAPSIRKVLGNDRLISVWPMRGGPVLSNGKIYFTVGVWPFEGVFLYTLDAKSGASTDQTPQRQIRTLRDATPQGYLVSTGSRLYIPCGRSVVTGFDLENDRLLDPFKYSASEVTTVHVSAMGRWLFHGKLSYDAESRTQMNIAAYHPVLTAEAAYFGD
jgi:outer membrane protein assembly factor BamB